MTQISPLTIAAWGLMILLGTFLILQSAVVFAFIMRLARFRQTASRRNFFPRAAVLLSVRGPDPFLAETLRNLIDQDYPDFSIHIVVDHPTDPALPVIESVKAEAETERITISFLHKPKSTCTLKCSSIVQGLEELQGTCDVVAFVDADACPHRQWLRELVAPLSDPTVGATTGNRWYMPQKPNYGSLVRYFWNAGSVVQMWLNDFLWAGSMAVPFEVIQKTGLLNAWKRALSLDNTVTQQLKKYGYQVSFVPTTILVNRESITFLDFVTWVQRQMVGVKTLKTGREVVALHALFLFTIQFVSMALAVMAATQGDVVVALVSLCALVSFWFVSLLTTFLIERAIQRVVYLGGDKDRWPSRNTIFKMVPAIVLTYATYAFVFVKSVFIWRVTWRGACYEIRGVGDIRLIAYRPYARSDTGEAEESNSVI